MSTHALALTVAFLLVAQTCLAVGAGVGGELADAALKWPRIVLNVTFIAALVWLLVRVA